MSNETLLTVPQIYNKSTTLTPTAFWKARARCRLPLVTFVLLLVRRTGRRAHGTSVDPQHAAGGRIKEQSAFCRRCFALPAASALMPAGRRRCQALTGLGVSPAARLPARTSGDLGFDRAQRDLLLPYPLCGARQQRLELLWELRPCFSALVQALVVISSPLPYPSLHSVCAQFHPPRHTSRKPRR